MSADSCACSCGNVIFETRDAPLFRILCHCTICQRFNDAPFADVVVYTASDVTAPAEGTVDYSTWKPPPNVQRGKCAQCGMPAIEQFTAPLFPKLTMVPAAMHGPGAELPEPVAHVFYDKRIEDADDSLPKKRGFLSSQLSFMRLLYSARASRR